MGKERLKSVWTADLLVLIETAQSPREAVFFCSAKGSGEHLKSAKNIASQVKKQIDYKKERANQFIVYFQNFTNTYDSLENLKRKYDAALIDSRIVALSIATRPDCITEEIAKLLSSYMPRYTVLVELGLQTTDENILKHLNRGYANDKFIEAVKILRKYGIEVIAHMMMGLPFENDDSIQNTVEFLNSCDIQGIKIHSCYIVEGTKLAQMYKDGDYQPVTLEYYLEKLAYIITHLRPDIIIHRISGDAPKDLLLAPEWNLHKKWVLNGIDKILKEQDLYQGMYYNKKSQTIKAGLPQI